MGGLAGTENQLSLLEELPVEKTPGLPGSGHESVVLKTMDLPSGSAVKNLPANTGDTGMVPGLGRSPRKGNGSAFQYSCWATVHGVTKCQTRRSD